MKICGSQLVGKVLGFFLMWHFCSNGHVVNGQVVRLDSAEVSNDLQTLTLTICFTDAESGSGTIYFTVVQNIFGFSSQQELMINNNQQCEDYPITIDNLPSDQIGMDATVFLTGASPNLQVSQSAGDSSHTVTIPGVFFDPAAYSTQEGSSPVMLNICRFPTDDGLSTTLMYTGGTADTVSDYTASPQSVDIQSGDQCATASIPIIDDEIIEGNETFTVSISQPSSLIVSSSRGTATVTIMDDDVEVNQVYFSTLTYEVEEPENAQTKILTLSVCQTVTNTDTTFTVTAIEVSATDEFDFSLPTTQETIPARSTCADISVSIFRDSLKEPDEIFQIAISVTSPNVVISGRGTATVTIRDNDPVNQVFFNSPTYEVDEPENASTTLQLFVCHTVTNTDTTLTVTAVEGSAEDTIDFSLPTTQVTIPSGSTCADISVRILSDSLKEPDEIFQIAVTVMSPDVVMSGQGTATVTILENDSVTEVFFDIFTYEVEEQVASTALPLRVCRSVTNIQATLVVAANGGSAEKGIDFSLSAEQQFVTFKEDEACADIFVSILPDTVKEPDETFQVGVSAVSSDVVVRSGQGIATVTIKDDDPDVVLECPMPPLIIYTGSEEEITDFRSYVSCSRGMSSCSSLTDESTVTCRCIEDVTDDCTFEVVFEDPIIGHRVKRDAVFADDVSTQTMTETIATEILETSAASENYTTTGMATASGVTSVISPSTDSSTSQLMPSTTTAAATSETFVTTLTAAHTTIIAETMTPGTAGTSTEAMTTVSTLYTDTADAITDFTTTDPCSPDPCDEKATCTITENRFNCTCDPGYTGDGRSEEVNGTGCTACNRTTGLKWMYGPSCSSPCTCASNANCSIDRGVCSGDNCDGVGQTACDKNKLSVTITNDIVIVNEKETISLECMVNLGPDDVTVTWEDSAGNAIQSTSNLEMTVFTVTILEAMAEDSGQYTCIGTLMEETNDVIFRNDSVLVNVKDFPEIDNLDIFERGATYLMLTWLVTDYGQDEVECEATHTEVNGDNVMVSTPCEKNESCEINNLTPDTEYDISVVCRNDAGLSNIETVTGRTIRSTPEEVPELSRVNEPDSLNSTSVVVILPKVTEENGQISCYEFVVVETGGSGDPDEEYPFHKVLNASGENGSPYRAVVMDRSTFHQTQRVVIGMASSPVTRCVLTDPTIKRKRRALIPPQTLTARNDPLKGEQAYNIFLRVYVPSGESYDYESSDYMDFETAKAPSSGSSGAIIAVLIILIIIIIVLVVVVLFIYRKRRADSEHARGNGEIMALQENGINEIEKVEPINIDELGNQILEKHQNNSRIFNAEFRSLLDVNPDTTFETFSRPANAEKNRYINIYCYDHSRVKLEEIDDVEHSDYINANYIDGYNVSNKFIAAQGPKSETVEDHWRMLWQQNTATVIMLTRCFEDGGREKCAQYWPDKGSQTFGVFTVHLDSIAECPDYVIRKFRVTKEGEEEGTYHTITQFHYLAWPDHGVPEYPYKMLAFIKRIRQMTPAKPEKGNIVVHCSAGVGRTGTYITIDAMLDRLREEKTVDIYNFIQSMRLNRRLLVQTVVQYIFIYHALHEEHLYGHTEIDLAGLHHYFRRLRLKTHSEDNSPLHNEFKTAATLPVKDTNSSEASVQANVEKNRTRNYLPYDRNRVKLERLVGDENSTYINASYINGYERKNMYITTQAPMENTTHDFWRMVWESLTSTIVMLTDLEEKGNEMCVKFWPEEEAKTFGNLTVELTSENEEDDYTTMEFIISNTEGVATRKVKMYRFHGWPEVGAPKCCEAVCDLVNVAHEHQRGAEREESAEQSKHPIVVFCHTGVGRTAVWVALAILMERARAEGVVDVFQTVRTLRQQRQHMIQDATQYEFLYEAVLRHLDTLDQYANFR